MSREEGATLKDRGKWAITCPSFRLLVLCLALSLFVYACRSKPIARGVNSKSSPAHLGMQRCWCYSQMYPCREESARRREGGMKDRKTEKRCSYRYERLSQGLREQPNQKARRKKTRWKPSIWQTVYAECAKLGQIVKPVSSVYNVISWILNVHLQFSLVKAH